MCGAGTSVPTVALTLGRFTGEARLSERAVVERHPACVYQCLPGHRYAILSLHTAGST